MARQNVIHSARCVAQVCSGWWSLMSGAISVPFGFLAVLLNGSPRILFAVLAFCALLVFAISVARSNYQLLKERKLVIHSAIWDAQKDVTGTTPGTDVTENVTSRVVDGKLDMLCHPSVLGDPCMGHRKALRLVFSVDGGRRAKIFEEDVIVHLP